MLELDDIGDAVLGQLDRLLLWDLDTGRNQVVHVQEAGHHCTHTQTEKKTGQGVFPSILCSDTLVVCPQGIAHYMTETTIIYIRTKEHEIIQTCLQVPECFLNQEEESSVGYKWIVASSEITD